MRICVGSDHAGLNLKKELLKSFASEWEFEIVDVGTYTEEPVDYPDIAKDVCRRIINGEADYGILICGTGIGMSIAANKFPGIRAALVYSDETAILAKRHNNANVICLGGRTMKSEDAIRYVKLWLKENFEGGRHERRIKKISRFEEEVIRGVKL